jgi:hypothetical protein
MIITNTPGHKQPRWYYGVCKVCAGAFTCTEDELHHPTKDGKSGTVAGYLPCQTDNCIGEVAMKETATPREAVPPKRMNMGGPVTLTIDPTQEKP